MSDSPRQGNAFRRLAASDSGEVEARRSIFSLDSVSGAPPVGGVLGDGGAGGAPAGRRAQLGRRGGFRPRVGAHGRPRMARDDVCSRESSSIGKVGSTRSS